MDRIGLHIITIAICFISTMGSAAGAVNIIPLPVSVEERAGEFVIDPTTHVIAEGEAAIEAAKLIEILAPVMGFRLSPGKRVRNSIQLDINSSLETKLGDEGYELEVTEQSIRIQAAKSAGLFYGIQTLRQLLPPAIFSPRKVEGIRWAAPCVRIIDHPQFQWRGLLIDPARHFIPIPDFKRFIDLMALHKFNRLQVHFTDDQGWRIEIKKHPKLTQTGAWMDFTTFRQMRGNVASQFLSRAGGEVHRNIKQFIIRGYRNTPRQRERYFRSWIETFTVAKVNTGPHQCPDEHGNGFMV